ncbi:DHHC palmitoyltransferase-domain-containing protein [Xylariales sp. PMI_506]|nr:DHHC palmitoyltransferase-domain-containing protein [Xylariales sp. PMI_506]
MAFLLGTSTPVALRRLAVPAVCLLIIFLAYGPQYLFAVSPDLKPGPLKQTERWFFNGLLLCLWWTYYKACTVNPGQYRFPPAASAAKKKEGKRGNDGKEDGHASDAAAGAEDGHERSNTPSYRHRTMAKRNRWCKKCARPKPPRAHHCRICARCIPKMDHHCPWTSNCVSLQTFPHFLRFLIYTNVSLWILLRFLWLRFYALWQNRSLPAYLGPTLPQLIWLTVFALTAAATSFMLGILLINTVLGWAGGYTMIEDWEKERHEAVLERYGLGDDEDGFWGDGEHGAGADNGHATVEPVEFPYDISFFSNMSQAMGTTNPLMWLFPLAGSPRVAPNTDGLMRGTGWEYEENGLNDCEGLWPPPDPAKTRHARAWTQRRRNELDAERAAFEVGTAARWDTNPYAERDAFLRRQQRDLRERGRILGELEEVEGGEYAFVEGSDSRPIIVNDDDIIAVDTAAGGVSWANAEGDHLGDYGVDEDAESEELSDGEGQGDQDEDVPLGELIRRRKVLASREQDTRVE